eukprot:gene14440-16581_t
MRSVRFASEQLALVHRETLSTNCHNLTDVIVCCDIYNEDDYYENDDNDENNCFTTELYAFLKNNPHIETDDIVLPKLTTLTLQWREIENEFLLALMKARSVVQLDLRGCEFKVPILSQIAALCPQLKKLDLSEYPDPVFSGSAVNTLLERCTQLRTVHLSGDGIPHFVFSSAAIRNLTTLEFDGNPAVMEQNLATIAANGDCLEKLLINRRYKPTHDTLCNLMNGCLNMKELRIWVPLEPGASIPEYLTGTHWEKIMPGLHIDLVVVYTGSL